MDDINYHYDLSHYPSWYSNIITIGHNVWNVPHQFYAIMGIIVNEQSQDGTSGIELIYPCYDLFSGYHNDGMQIRQFWSDKNWRFQDVSHCRMFPIIPLCFFFWLVYFFDSKTCLHRFLSPNPVCFPSWDPLITLINHTFTTKAIIYQYGYHSRDGFIKLLPGTLW